MTFDFQIPFLYDDSNFADAVSVHLYHAMSRVKMESEFYEHVFQTGQIGAWEYLFDVRVLCHTPSWRRLFLMKNNDPLDLNDYLELIDNAIDRERVRRGRENLLCAPPGTKWHDCFSLCGKHVQSTAQVFDRGRIIGVDVVLKDSAIV